MDVRNTSGRKMLTTSVKNITRDNVYGVILDSEPFMLGNTEDIKYLWNYYKGVQPILERKKEFRENINNIVVENHANEVVSFYEGFVFGEPIIYTVRNNAETVSKGIDLLNDMMYAEGKASLDKTLGMWELISGIAYRLVLPGDESEPFHIYTLDPRNTHVIYSNDFRQKPVMGIVKTVDDVLGDEKYSVYTDRRYFEIVGGKVTVDKPHALGDVPIFEYPLNMARMGVFEAVIPLLDGINTVASNRIDSLEQYVQSFLKFVNCDIDEDTYKEFLKMGAIKVKSIDGAAADVDIVSQELNQSQTQTLVDYMYQTVLTICGIPNRNGGTSTSDTGIATIFRDGWETAEARAKSIEMAYKESELRMLRLVLRICQGFQGVDQALKDLKISDVGIQFTRRNYENAQSKSQVLVTMLNNPKIHPRLAFEHCGMFSDPEDAWKMSEEYYQAEMEKWQPVEIDNEDNLR